MTQFNLADVFETVATSVPDRIALTYEDRNLTYAQLDGEANRAAHMLAEAGVSEGDHVSLFLKNSVEHVTSILGLIKIRAVPINVNYRYTPTELEYIFTNSDSVAVVVELPDHQRVLAGLLDKCPLIRSVVVGEVTAELRRQQLCSRSPTHTTCPPTRSSRRVPVTTCTCSTRVARRDTRRV